MRYSIFGFKQEELIKYDIDMTDVLLLDYIQKALAQPSMKKTFKDNQPYVWLKHSKILTDLPILHLQERGLKARISKLNKQGIIKSIQISNEKLQGSNTYYTISDLVEGFQYDNSKKPDASECTCSSEPSALKCTSSEKPGALECTSDNILYNNNQLEEDNKKVVSNETTNNKPDTVTLEEETKEYDDRTHFRLSSGKIVSKTTKSPKYIAEYIGQMRASDKVEKNNKFKKTLLDWYYSVGVGITSILQLEKKLDRIFETNRGDLEKTIDSIETAYVNGWKAFYPTNNYSKKKNSHLEINQGEPSVACNFLFENGRQFDAEIDGKRDEDGELITF